MAVTHAKTDATPEGADATKVRASDWNAAHVGVTTVATDTLWAAKGDLAVATANDTAGVLTAPTTRGQRLGADAAGNLTWKPLVAGPSGVRLWDEMFYGNVAITTTNTPLGAGSIGLTGTAAAFGGNALTGTANHPGVCSLATGTTTTGMARFFMGGGSLALGGGTVRYGAWVYLPVLSVVGDRFEVIVGFSDSTSLAGTVDGAFFYYKDTVNSGKWQVVTSANSVTTATVTDTGVAAVQAATWYCLEAEVNAAGTSITYYVNGTSVVTHSANIPTGAGRETGFEMVILKSLGTTTTLLDIDAYYLDLDFTTAR